MHLRHRESFFSPRQTDYDGQMSRRHVETLTDFLIVAISPALIIFLVCSLVFFLSDMFYDGSFPARMRFASALFVTAAVLIARISIEEGREYASFFALPLSLVTVLSMLKYTDASLLMVLPLVGFVWWATDKLTWDCTVVDDHKDTSGVGLLQTIGGDHESQEVDEDATTDSERSRSASVWERWLAYRRRHHTPGVWVVYFGIGGLPIFGLGQLMLPESARPVGFLLLCIYVASTLSLLMTTSFLQMRRYLIQRRLPFTDQMASTWLGTGGVLVVGLMLGALLLPRPHTGYSILESFDRVASRNDLQANQRAIGDEGLGDKDTRGSGRSNREVAESESESGNQRSDTASAARASDQASDKQSENGAKQSDESQARSTDSPSREAQRRPSSGESSQSNNKQRTPDRNATSKKSQRENQRSDSSAQSTTRSAPPTNVPSLPTLSFGNLAKWAYFLLLAVIVVAVLLRYGREIGNALQSFWRELQDLLWRLLGGSPRRHAEDHEVATDTESSLRPFSSYQDPFLMGTEGQFTPQQLVGYTFEALQAWARERNCPRTDEQTPLEFATIISTEHEQVGKLAQNLAILYNQAAYAPGTLTKEANQHLRSLWGALRRPK